MLRNRCWPTIFHTSIAGDADGWCQKWLVWLAPHAPITSKFVFGSRLWYCWKLCWKIDGGPPFSTLLQSEMPTNGAWSGWCDQPLVPRSHQTFRLIPAVKLLKNRCWPTIFHTIIVRDANKWCMKWPVWSTPRAPTTTYIPADSSCEIVEK